MTLTGVWNERSPHAWNDRRPRLRHADQHRHGTGPERSGWRDLLLLLRGLQGSLRTKPGKVPFSRRGRRKNQPRIIKNLYRKNLAEKQTARFFVYGTLEHPSRLFYKLRVGKVEPKGPFHATIGPAKTEFLFTIDCPLARTLFSMIRMLLIGQALHLLLT